MYYFGNQSVSLFSGAYPCIPAATNDVESGFFKIGDFYDAKLQSHIKCLWIV
ncbi:hypothetical protein TRIP_B40251 [uncultured Desulfatiglans sp.]|nr:hypothetical protein TRIP_B40251 [uncultured Desulfatiglans sp.]